MGQYQEFFSQVQICPCSSILCPPSGHITGLHAAALQVTISAVSTLHLQTLQSTFTFSVLHSYADATWRNNTVKITESNSAIQFMFSNSHDFEVFPSIYSYFVISIENHKSHLLVLQLKVWMWTINQDSMTFYRSFIEIL